MQTPHILIVEDELVTRNTLKSIFEAEGYDVFEATDGAEMHQILSEYDINLVIMDINLPGKNGLLLARELREQANVALMFLTGRDNEVDKILGLEIGADDYITKPFHPRHILATVEQLLHKRTVLKEYFNSARSDVTVREGITLHHEDERMLHEIVVFIENNIDDESLNPTAISDFIGIGKTSLYEKLKELTGKTPGEYIRMVRLDRASKLLRTTQLTVQEIMYKSGFSSKSYFYKEFAVRFGLSPKEYRKANCK